jgi:hypothetical protein
MGTGGRFLGGKAWPGRDADHSPPSSAEVKYEWEPGAVHPKGQLGLSPTLLLETKKKDWIFEKQLVHCIYNLCKERR